MLGSDLPVRPVAPSGDWDARADAYLNRPGLQGSPAVHLVLALLGAFAAYAVVSAPLPLGWQVLFGVICLLVALQVNAVQGRLVTIGLMALSILLSTRYVFWRLTESLDYRDPQYDWIDIVFATGLIAAELYAFVVLLLGYLQTLWPLQREPVAMSTDVSSWPTVDVMIPTLDEPLSVIRPTIIAAMDMDWPHDRLRVMVLDDGRREALEAMCRELGATYLRRERHTHAKAGNVNHGLQHSRAEFVAIFDCDQVPTRSFLQVCLGWFAHDHKLAMLQTPQHFFSPDPFERNLGTFRQIPNEGELFYGLVQDGNDLWNATFFCGSCAVLRRSALDEVGGLAVETVTEDAHTSLRLQRRGWNTAYLNLPQAAGRATESLAGHIRQRIRWARGMAQIFRIDNPLTGPGLSLMQRLCYLNAMLHFFSGLPRIVFLTAPLAFLIFDAKTVIGSALVFAAYALPHLIHSQLTHSRMQGPYRYSFWAEVYETILCVYTVLPTLAAVLSPKLGRFNVTPKGTRREHSAFDARIAWPYLVLLVMNLFGFAYGTWRLLTQFGDDADSLVLNLLWTTYNIVILGVCTAVAWEQREVRRSVRVTAELPARLQLPDGTEVEGRTVDLSEGGVMLRLSCSVNLPLGSRVQVALLPGQEPVWTPVDVTRSGREILALKFAPMSLAQERQLIFALFGRADAWMNWSEPRPPDRIGSSFGELCELGLLSARKALGASKT